MSRQDKTNIFSGFARAMAQRVRGRSTSSPDDTQPAVIEDTGKPAVQDQPAYVRPPGAVSEDQFLQVCGGCGSCIAECPYGVIQFLGSEYGSNVEGTPAILPAVNPCLLCPDMPCAAACSTGGLVPMAPSRVFMGTAVITDDLCVIKAGQDCEMMCVTKCPLGQDAITVQSETGMPLVNVRGCTGCGICAHECPADAINIAPNRESQRMR
ncbi:MAG: 4Fe-4S dicluster domain-containing protein [Planctomycetes bacterium]|nr:4Fe-4S dicluster domain-containing protein [Planctomycetota bacterium]NOG55987.1 4Fe-4S binding protein [Planctomycetota bacterium]